jgi:hypothetical protein
MELFTGLAIMAATLLALGAGSLAFINSQKKETN